MEGRVITTNRKKADSFGRHYAQVSKLRITKAERNRSRDLKKMTELKDEVHHEERCSDLSLNEMESTLKAI